MNAQPSIAIIEDEADRIVDLRKAAKTLGLKNVWTILAAREGTVDKATRRRYITIYNTASLVAAIEAIPCPRIIIADVQLSAIDINLSALQRINMDRGRQENMGLASPNPLHPAAVLFDCYSKHANRAGENGLVLYSTTGAAKRLAASCWPDGRVAGCEAELLEPMAKTIVIHAMNVYFGMPLRQEAFVAALQAWHSGDLAPPSICADPESSSYEPWCFFSQRALREPLLACKYGKNKNCE